GGATTDDDARRVEPGAVALVGGGEAGEVGNARQVEAATADEAGGHAEPVEALGLAPGLAVAGHRLDGLVGRVGTAVVVGRGVPAAERLGGLVDALLEAAAEQVGAVGESGGVEVAEEGLGLLQPPSCSVPLGVLDPGGGTLAPGDVGLRGEAGLAEAFVESGRRCLGVGPGGGVGD